MAVVLLGKHQRKTVLSKGCCRNGTRGCTSQRETRKPAEEKRGTGEMMPSDAWLIGSCGKVCV